MNWDSALPGELKAHKRGILVLRGPRPRRSVIAAATALVVSLGWAVAGAAAPAMASSCGNNGTTWKQVHLGLLGDGNGGQLAVDMSDSWGGANTCLFVPGITSDFAGSFQVESQTAPSTGGVLGYPDTEIGCSSGYCTTASGLPAPVSANPDPDLSWYYDTADAVRGSKYDAMIDSEFSAACSGSAPPMNAAVAIYTYGYPSYPSIGVPHSGPTVSIEGLDWYTGHFLDGSKYVSQFVLAEPVVQRGQRPHSRRFLPVGPGQPGPQLHAVRGLPADGEHGLRDLERRPGTGHLRVLHRRSPGRGLAHSVSLAVTVGLGLGYTDALAFLLGFVLAVTHGYAHGYAVGLIHGFGHAYAFAVGLVSG